MHSLMDEWRMEFDFVVVDSPPVLPVVDDSCWKRSQTLRCCWLASVIPAGQPWSAPRSCCSCIARISSGRQSECCSILFPADPPHTTATTVITAGKNMNTSRDDGMMRAFRSVLILFCCAGCCLAQTESLTIGPGDMLHLKVLEAPELEQGRASKRRGHAHS